MKRLMLALTALAFNGSVAAEWVKVFENDSYAAYIDQEHIDASGPMRKVWGLIDYKYPTRDGVMSMRYRSELDCADQLYRFLEKSYFSWGMGGGELLGTTNVKGYKWQSFAPDTFGSTMLELFCKK